MTAAQPAAMAGQRRIELADVFNRYGDSYLRAHHVRPAQARVLQAIRLCRTAALGGHCDWCSQCGFVRYAYHSCRNRHCPKCQTFAKEQWLEQRRQELLPTHYFHNVFTLPHELNPIVLCGEQNQRRLLRLLFQAAADTLLQFGRNNLGGRLGFTLVLHTWDQQLRPHFHVHAIVAGGALSHSQDRWIPVGQRFLFPVRALSTVFRAKFLDALSKLLDTGQLQLPTALAELATPEGSKRWLRRLKKKPWIVYSKAPFAGPKKLLDYLARYTHRVAIANHRFLSIDNDRVQFHYRDRADGDRRKVADLPASQFIRRFLHHVLPNGFMKIRHYGFLANRHKKQALARCRELLHVVQPPDETHTETVADWMLRLTGQDITRCPRCGSDLRQFELTPHTTEPATLFRFTSYFDTS